MKHIEELVDVFYRMQVQHAHMVQVLAVRHELNPVDIRVVKLLGAQESPLTVKQVGEYLKMGSGAMNALVNRLDRRRLVERIPNPADRRSVLVRLLPAGCEIVRELRGAYRRGLVAAFEHGEERWSLSHFDSIAAEFQTIADAF